MKKVIVYCYNRCTTCKKAIKYLEENITILADELK